MTRTRLLALLAVLAMVVAACGGDGDAETTTTADSGTGDTTATTEAGEETPEPTEPPSGGGAGEGGHLQLLMWQAPSTLNGYLSTGTKDTMGASLILEPLASFGPETEIVPKLAADVPTLENGGHAEDLMSVTWTLKEGLLWSDGTPVTAADVVFTWEYCTAEGSTCSQTGSFAGVTSVEAVDDLNVKINFDAPTPYPYLPFVGGVSPVLQAAQFADCLGEAAPTCTDQNFAPIGTGPFMVTNFLVDDTVDYAVNPNYREFADGKPFFGTVQIKGGGDATQAARSVLEIPEADYAWNLQVPPDVLEPMIAAGNGELFVGFAANVEHINLNQTDPRSDTPSDFVDGNNPHPVLHGNPDFARALSMAIDREELTAVGYGVAGAPTCNVWPSPPAVSTTHDWCLTQDIEGANALLDGLGYEDTNGDGTREHPVFGELVFDFNTSTNQVRQDFQALIQGYWSQIGIGMNPRNVDASVYFSGGGDADTLVRFDADMQMYTFVPLPGGQSHFAGYTTAEMTDSSTGFGGANAVRYSNPEYDALYETLAVTVDPDERNELIKQLSDMIVADGAVIPLVWRASASAFANDIQGYETLNGWDSEFWNIADWYREG